MEKNKARKIIESLKSEVPLASGEHLTIDDLGNVFKVYFLEDELKFYKNKPLKIKVKKKQMIFTSAEIRKKFAAEFLKEREFLKKKEEF